MLRSPKMQITIRKPISEIINAWERKGQSYVFKVPIHKPLLL